MVFCTVSYRGWPCGIRGLSTIHRRSSLPTGAWHRFSPGLEGILCQYIYIYTYIYIYIHTRETHIQKYTYVQCIYIYIYHIMSKQEQHTPKTLEALLEPPQTGPQARSPLETRPPAPLPWRPPSPRPGAWPPAARFSFSRAGRSSRGALRLKNPGGPFFRICWPKPDSPG